MLDLQRAFLRAAVQPDEIDFVTMLRDPIERVISEFYWVMRGVPNTCAAEAEPRHRLAWDYELPCNASLASSLADVNAARRAHNRQTKMLAGLGDFEASDAFASDAAMLSAAKRTLQARC